MTKMPIKILLFEDNNADARLLSETLKDIAWQKYDIIHVTSLADGLAILTNNRIDVILLDLGLPDSDRLHGLIKIKSVLVNVPIVVLTGNDDEDIALQAVQRGAQDYLVKQKVDAEVISRVIRYAMERQKLLDKLHSLALTDDLTGLYNRRGFFTLAEHHIKLSHRMHKNFYIIYSDVDNLKRINDEFGHLEGDNTLINIANILLESFRDSDIIARIGGDEFIILMSDSSHASIENAVSRLQKNINKFNKKKNKKHDISLSIGISHFHPQIKISLQELIDKADKLLYEQKKGKRKA
jgi:diguanylate cyclase (GGDEF)-like protein